MLYGVVDLELTYIDAEHASWIQLESVNVFNMLSLFEIKTILS